MLERKEYNIKMEAERRAQAENISEYLMDFIKVNSIMRDEPISEPTKEILEKVESMGFHKEGRDAQEVGNEIVKYILTPCMRLQHPKNLSFVCSSVSPYSIAGGLLTEIYNPNVAGWELAPTAAMIEEKLIKWMGSLAGFGPKCGGLFTSGGSLSNLTCLIAARENLLPGRVDLPLGAAFFSDQAHSSIIKAMRIMGLRDDQVYIIETDDKFKIRLDILEEKIKEAKDRGLKPFLMIANLGSTNTGSIDPISEMSEIAQKNGMWLHCDGAYGGSILFSDIYRNLAKGVEKADSMSWDTHKWAMQTYSCSCIIVKDKQKLINAYYEHPEYLTDVINAEHSDGWDLGIEMSRPARFIKLWYTIQAMGTDLLSDVIDYSFHNAYQAEKALSGYPDWTIISKPSCCTFTVRYEPKDVDPSRYDELNAAISREINRDGFAHILTTTLKGKKVIRIIVINSNTETEDVLNVVERLNDIAVSVKKEFCK